MCSLAGHSCCSPAQATQASQGSCWHNLQGDAVQPVREVWPWVCCVCTEFCQPPHQKASLRSCTRSGQSIQHLSPYPRDNSKIFTPQSLLSEAEHAFRQGISGMHTWNRTWSTTTSLSTATVCRLVLEKEYVKLPICLGGTGRRCSKTGSKLPFFLVNLYPSDSHPTYMGNVVYTRERDP